MVEDHGPVSGLLERRLQEEVGRHAEECGACSGFEREAVSIGSSEEGRNVEDGEDVLLV